MIEQILPKGEQEKKRRRNQLILGGVLILVMFMSVLGYGFSDTTPGSTNTDKVTYNGYEFVNQNGGWLLQLGDFQFIFKNNPNQVPVIAGEVKPLSDYSGKPLYISSEDINAEFELYQVFNSVILRRQYACLEGESCTQDYPVKNCTENFVIINEDEATNLTRRDNCIFISGPEENLTAIVDEFLFKTIGIK